MDKKTTEEHLKSPLVPWWFWALAAGIVLLWALGPQVVRLWMGWMGAGGGDAAAAAAGAGTFGDQFGAINTLFSGLAFLGVLVSLWIQGREFRHQLEEMRVNAQEMQTQSKIYDEQLKMLRRQNDLLGHQLINAQVQERLAAQPFLEIGVSMSKKALVIEIRNHGSTIYGFELRVAEDGLNQCVRESTLSSNMDIWHNEIVMDNASSLPQITLYCDYVTRLGHGMREIFILTPPYHVDRMIPHSDMMSIGRQILAEIKESHAFG